MIELDLKGQALYRLEELKEELGVKTEGDVIRKALQLLDQVLDARDEGSELILRDKAGNETKLLVILL